MAQDSYWHGSGGGTTVGALEAMLAELRDELERTHGVATEARELARQALEAAEEARAAAEQERTASAELDPPSAGSAGRQPGPEAEGEGTSRSSRARSSTADSPTPASRSASGAASSRSGPASTADASWPPGRDDGHGVSARSSGSAGRGGRDADADPLASALADFAAELQAAAEARRRGELDVWEAMRLLRGGFHKTRRVLGSLQRRDVGRA